MDMIPKRILVPRVSLTPSTPYTAAQGEQPPLPMLPHHRDTLSCLRKELTESRWMGTSEALNHSEPFLLKIASLTFCLRDTKSTPCDKVSVID